MAAPKEYSGLLLGILVQPGNATYKAQRTRVHIHGDTGDVTSGLDTSKRRIGTVPDFEVTITKASFDPTSNPFAAPFNWVLFTFVPAIGIYPNFINVLNVNAGHQFTYSLIDDIELDQDANMLQPLSLHLMCADGTSPYTAGAWFPTAA